MSRTSVLLLHSALGTLPGRHSTHSTKWGDLPLGFHTPLTPRIPSKMGKTDPCEGISSRNSSPLRMRGDSRTFWRRKSRSYTQNQYSEWLRTSQLQYWKLRDSRVMPSKSEETSGYIPKITENRDSNRYLYTTFTAAEFATVQRWKEPKHLLADEWINKLWSIHKEDMRWFRKRTRKFFKYKEKGL